MTMKNRQQASLMGGQTLDPSLVNDHAHHLARVIDAFPERNLIDVMLLDGGGVIRDVQVMTPSGTSKSGLVDLVNISFHDKDAFFTPDTSNEKVLANDGLLPNPGIRPRVSTTFKEVDDGFNAYAVISFLGGKVANPVCIGFLYPETSEMMFFEQHKIDRHHSDIYNLIDSDGNFEQVFPDGTFLRVGEGVTRTDLVAKDVNEKWKTKADDPATQEPAKTIHLQHTTGTAITVNPDGSVAINVVADKDITVTGNKTESIDGDHSVINKSDKTEQTTGNDTNTVGGDLTEEVSGDSSENIDGQKSINVPQYDLNAMAVNLMTTSFLLEMQTGNIEATDLNIQLANMIVTGASISLISPIVNLGPAAIEGVLPGNQWFNWALTHTHPVPGGPPAQTPPPPSTTVRVSL